MHFYLTFMKNAGTRVANHQVLDLPETLKTRDSNDFLAIHDCLSPARAEKRMSVPSSSSSGNVATAIGFP